MSNAKTLRAVLVRPDASCEIVDVEKGSLQAVYDLLHCSTIEAVRPDLTEDTRCWLGYVNQDERGWLAYVDENGKLNDSPEWNFFATFLACENGWPAGDIIAGSALFLGDDGEDDCDVPSWLVACMRHYVELQQR